MSLHPSDDSSATGRLALESPGSLGVLRVSIGLIQGLILFLLYRAVANPETLTWPATQPELYAALLLPASFAPVLLLAGVGRMGWKPLAIWAAAATLVLALLGWHDAANQDREYLSPPFMDFPVVAFSAAALFIAHHLIVPAVTARRWIADFDDYFDTAWKAGVQLVLSLCFTGAFWLLLFLGAALFKVIGLIFLADLISEDWFAIPITCLVFAIAVHLTDVRSSLIRGVRTVALMLLSWLLLVMTVLVAGFVAALPFTGLELLWKTGSATAMLLSAAATLIILSNAAYQDGREDNLPPKVLRIAVRVASLLLLPLMALVVWGLALRIGQYGLTPDRIIASACALVGWLYAVGYTYASLKPLWQGSPWMKALELTNVMAAVLTVGLILALFSPLLDPKRLSIHDQVRRLENGQTQLDQFDFEFLRFDTGLQGQRALQRLSASKDPAIAAKAKASIAAKTRSYHLDPQPTKPIISAWPVGSTLPADFFTKVYTSDPRNLCRTAGQCLAMQKDMNGDGQNEVLLAASYSISLFAHTAEGWRPVGEYRLSSCGTTSPPDHREHLKSMDLSPVTPLWPDFQTGQTRMLFTPNQACR